MDLLTKAITDLESKSKALEVARYDMQKLIYDKFKGKNISLESDYNSYEQFVIEDVRVIICKSDSTVEVILYPKSTSEFKERSLHAFVVEGELKWQYDVYDKRFWMTDRFNVKEFTMET